MVNPAVALAFFFQENAADVIASPESSGVAPFITSIVLWLIFFSRDSWGFGNRIWFSSGDV